MTKVRTICAQCGVGCGLVAWRAGEQQLEIEGDSRHPANRGALCLRGWHLADMLEPEARLARPRVGGRAAGWSKALSTVAARLTDTVARDGPESVAFLLSGALLTEDAYVANKLMKGFIGAANIGTASPAHRADAAALVRAFGEDVGTAGLEDVDRAELVVMLGQDVPARHPLAMDRAKAANRGQGARLAVIGADAASYESDADICLPIRTGSAAALMRGLLAWCRRAGAVDEGWLAARVTVPEGFWDALAEGADLWSVARACDVPACDVQRFFDLVVALRE
jgi:assimilatory nitrate reductase catalytic subunit